MRSGYKMIQETYTNPVGGIAGDGFLCWKSLDLVNAIWDKIDCKL